MARQHPWLSKVFPDDAPLHYPIPLWYPAPLPSGGECEPYKPQSLLNQVAKLKGYIHEAHLIKQDPQY